MMRIVICEFFVCVSDARQAIHLHHDLAQGELNFAAFYIPVRELGELVFSQELACV